MTSKQVKTCGRTALLGIILMGCASAQAGSNPLIGGTWTFSSGGLVAGACARTRTFAPKSQTFEAFGKIQTRNVSAYAFSGTTVYVQERPGSGGTVAYVVLSKNEITDTLGTGACHWKR